MDTSDAALLVEARRIGVTSIPSAHLDLRRAQLDFAVFTWLEPSRFDLTVVLSWLRHADC